MSVMEIKRAEDGEPLIIERKVPLNWLKYDLLTASGKLYEKDPEDESPARSFRFRVTEARDTEGIKIDPNYITKIELPSLDYSNNEPLFATVHSLVPIE